MELFAEEVCEVRHESQRLVLRLHPIRLEQLAGALPLAGGSGLRQFSGTV
jgi:hypothetical protein